MPDYGNVLNTVNKCLKSPSYLSTSISTNAQKQVCVDIKRKADDKTRLDESGNLQMAFFKRNLGLKDGVISKNNNSYAVTDRATWSDCGTLDKGSTLSVPLKELGQKYHLFRGDENKALRDAVNNTSS